MSRANVERAQTSAHALNAMLRASGLRIAVEVVRRGCAYNIRITRDAVPRPLVRIEGDWGTIRSVMERLHAMRTLIHVMEITDG